MATLSAESDQSQPPLLGRWPVVWWALVVLIFAAGLAVRVYDLTDAPLDFHGTRQLHSAFIARGMYYQNLESVPDWQREMAVRQWHAEGMIEPQMLERLVAWTYRQAGGAYLWIPRLYSILFWMLGGAALLWTARQVIGKDGALVAVLFYLIYPYGVIASRSFQPDPLMVSLIVWTLWALVHWDRRPNWGWSIATGLLAGATIYVKSVAVFFIAPALAGFLLANLGFRGALRSRKVWTIGVLGILPYMIYHIDGVYIHKFLIDQFSLRFFPQLWTDPALYLRWNGELTRAVGFELFLLSLVCAFLVTRKEFRVMLLAMYVGYFAYGLALPHHISTHDYYQLPLYPLVALGLGAGADLALRSIREKAWIAAPAVIGVLLFALTMKGWDARSTLKRSDYRGEIQYWETLGKVIPEGEQVAGLVHDYGYRLSYWGWVIPTNWMMSGDFNLREMAGQDTSDIEGLFAEATAGKSFFLVTLLEELDKQPELKRILEDYPVYQDGGDYIIWDLRQKK